MEIFIELSFIIAITTFVSFILKKLHQPLVVGYILSGIIVGPSLLNLLHSNEIIEVFSKLGISMLLFIVGLHLSPKIIKEVGSVSLITGVGQVLFTSLIGFVISIALGITTVAALYVSIALTFSSTIIILKLLSDKGDVHALYGKIAVGFLLVQDIVAAIILILVSALTSSANPSLLGTLTLLIAKGVVVFVLFSIITKFILPKLLKESANHSELLFLFSLTWTFGFAAIFYLLGFSIEIGALIAGVAVSTSPFAEEINARLRPLRDFFIVLFFVLLGASMHITSVGSLLLPTLVLSLFVLIGNPIIVVIIMNTLGYHRKTGFMAGLTVAQISEFSLILASLGFKVGHIDQEVLTIITLIGLVTISFSTYLILYAERLYPLIERYLVFLELRKNKPHANTANQSVTALIFGYNRVGHRFLDVFKKLGYRVGVVDIDPATLDRIPAKGVRYFYGDAEMTTFLEELPIKKLKFAVSSIKNFSTNVTLVKYLVEHTPDAIIVVFAETPTEATQLYAAGASLVILPHFVGAEVTAALIMRSGHNPHSFARKKNSHLKELGLV